MATNQMAYLTANRYEVAKHYYASPLKRDRSVVWEIEHMRKYKSKHSFEVKWMNDNTYLMPRFLFSLGDYRNAYPERIRRTLFTLSRKEICRQIDEIVDDLEASGLTYYDINPGNILFSESERLLKLTDFYWCNRQPPKEAKINKYYSQNDREAAKKVKEEVMKLSEQPLVEAYNIKKVFVNRVGHKYNDGSHVAPGVTYQYVDVPGFTDLPCLHDNCKEQYEIIKKHILPEFEDVVDIGCASGYHLFNLIRDFSFVRAIGYETDPEVVSLLGAIKNIYKVNNLTINGKFDDTTKFLTDVTIWMNSHQWINKEIGAERTKKALANVIASSKQVFFQTAGRESAGTSIVGYLKDKEQIAQYIRDAGGEPEWLVSTTRHGGIRHMFKINCPKEEA